MGELLAFAAYSVYAIFCLRVLVHTFRWYRAAGGPGGRDALSKEISFSALMKAGFDLISFRRLLDTNRWLWIASWIFHISLFLVLLRHSWYFVNPVPDIVIFFQPAGIFAGHLLPVSLVAIFIMRISEVKNRYISPENMFLLCLIFAISIMGLMMRYFFQPDLIEVKEFITGLLVFSPEAPPESFSFIVHFMLFLLLLPFIPFHLFAAPIVTLEARRREEQLRKILHEE
jgi:nitrate reductase gamma subunit